VVHTVVWLDDDVSPEDAREAAIEAEPAPGIGRLDGPIIEGRSLLTGIT
jgi:hypothetical protein